MRQLLATIILGGALAVTASAAFAHDRVYSMPSEPSTSGVALQSSDDSVMLPGTDVQPTLPIRDHHN